MSTSNWSGERNDVSLPNGALGAVAGWWQPEAPEVACALGEGERPLLVSEAHRSGRLFLAGRGGGEQGDALLLAQSARALRCHLETQAGCRSCDRGGM